jgi:hypothetical protein
MIRKKIFCVIGLDFFHRQRAIDRIKFQILKNKNYSLNTTTLYSGELDTKRLQEAVFHFSFDREKIILFRNSQKLPSDIKNFLLKEINKIIVFNYVIFEIERDYREFVSDKKIIQDTFFRYILKNSTLRKIHSFKEDISLKKFIIDVRRNRFSSALYKLERLFLEFKNDKKLGVQILGALVREFSYLAGQRQKYFDLLWDTDRLIKEKGIDPKLALEILITKLHLATNPRP